MRITIFSTLVGVALGLVSDSQGADFLERLGIKKGSSTEAAPAEKNLAAFTPEQLVSGLKEALAKGVTTAVATLGKENGFLKEAGVKIPIPDSMQRVEKTLRTLRQDKLADDFITAMNRAAEQAVPESAAILGEAIKRMSVADAKAVLTGSTNAATEYFRRTSETDLLSRLLPIVKKSTERVGVTNTYKQMMEKVNAGGLRGILGGGPASTEALDLDTYVTKKALDGLFLKIAEQEKLIRENPVARTTDLLQKVFGAIGR